MKKKIFSAIIAAIMIIGTTLCTLTVSFGDVGAEGYSDVFGNKRTKIVELKPLNQDTYINSVQKCFSGEQGKYSKFGVNPNESTINKMYVWVCANADGSSVQSIKYPVLPDGAIHTIKYTNTGSFPVNSTIYFYGEQGNIKSLKAKTVIYSY